MLLYQKWAIAIYAVAFLFFHTLAPAQLLALNYPGGLFQQVLNNPDDPDLNISFATSAEANGDLRHALAAYERLLHADPQNATARQGFNRLRLKLSPVSTSLHVSLSVRGHSGALAGSSINTKEREGTLDGVFSLRDERSLSRVRWRSYVLGSFRTHAEFEELNEFHIGALTGPVFQLGEGTTLHIAGGGGARYLDSSLFYSQATSRLTLDYLSGGTRQSVTATIATRHRGDTKFTSTDPNICCSTVSDRAFVMELKGKFSFHDNLRAGDVMFIRPRATYIDVNGDHQNTIFDDTLLFQDMKEFGSRVSYYMPLALGNIYLGAGLSVFHRDFSKLVSGGSKKRHDLYIEPSAHLVLPGIFGEQADFRVDYRFKHNNSNDATRDYDTHVLGLKYVRRF